MSDTAGKPVEQTQAQVVLPADANRANNQPMQDVIVVPTQVRRPWQATIRTGFQALLALATLLPLVLTSVYDSPDAYPAAAAQVVFVAGLVSRIMALPQVEVFLRTYLPFLAAAPPPPSNDEDGAVDLILTGFLIALAAVFVVGWSHVLAIILVIVGVAVAAYGHLKNGKVIR